MAEEKIRRHYWIQDMESRQTIDRNSYEPAYAQLVKILRQQIASGKFRPESQLPSEALICKRYKVSPMTVRRAINVLLDQGVVTTIQGRGTFVKGLELGSSTFDLNELQNLFRDKEQTRVKLLEARILSANGHVAEKLDIQAGNRVIYVRRLLLKNGEPVLYHQEHLLYDPRRPIVEAELDVTSLHGLFSGTGETDIKKGSLTIKSALLTQEEAALFNKTAPIPAFGWSTASMTSMTGPLASAGFYVRPIE